MTSAFWDSWRDEGPCAATRKSAKYFISENVTSNINPSREQEDIDDDSDDSDTDSNDSESDNFSDYP
jgi:hypothetical protein